MEINYDKWCKQCTNYKLDLSRGIICKLTQKKPDFIEDCNDFRSDTDRLDHQEARERVLERRNNSRTDYGRNSFYDWLYEQKLLLPLVIVLSICSIIYLNTSSARSLVFAIVINIYVIYLLISTRYASKSERYVLAENKRVKKVLGPGIITDPSIWKCKKVQINLFAPDLVNEKYDFKLKERLNDRLNNEGFL